MKTIKLNKLTTEIAVL